MASANPEVTPVGSAIGCGLWAKTVPEVPTETTTSPWPMPRPSPPPALSPHPAETTAPGLFGSQSEVMVPAEAAAIGDYLTVELTGTTGSTFTGTPVAERAPLPALN